MHISRYRFLSVSVSHSLNIYIYIYIHKYINIYVYIYSPVNLANGRPIRVNPILQPKRSDGLEGDTHIFT